MSQFDDVKTVILQAKENDKLSYDEFIRCLTTLLRYSALRTDINNKLGNTDTINIPDADIADCLDFIDQAMREIFSREEHNDNKLINFLNTSQIILNHLHNKNITEMIGSMRIIIKNNYEKINQFLTTLYSRQNAYVSKMSWWEWTKYQSTRLASHIRNKTSLKLLTGFMHWGAEHITQKAPITRPIFTKLIPELVGTSVQLLVFFPTLSPTLAKKSGKETASWLKAVFSNKKLLADQMAAMGIATSAYLYTAPLLASMIITGGVNLVTTNILIPDLESANNLPRYPNIPCSLNLNTVLYALNASFSLASAALTGEPLLLVSGIAVLSGNAVVGKASQKILGVLARNGVISRKDVEYYTLIIITGNSILIRFIFNNIIEEIRIREALTNHFGKISGYPDSSCSEFSFPDFINDRPWHPNHWLSKRETTTVFSHQIPGKYQFFECPHLSGGNGLPCSPLYTEENCHVLETNQSQVLIFCNPPPEDVETAVPGCELAAVSPGSSFFFTVKVARRDANELEVEYGHPSEPVISVSGNYPCSG